MNRLLWAVWMGYVSLIVLPVADADESMSVQRLTHDGHFKQRPTWSPDGNRVLFARHEGSTIFLWQLDLKTGEESRLTERTDPEYDAVFSPSGEDVLLAIDKASPNQGDIDIHVIHLADGNAQPVAVTEGKLSHEEWPSWSPDGKRFTFTSTRHDNQEVYTADRDGQNVERLTGDPATDMHPDWSPNGRTIAFATNRWGDLEIALYDLATHDLRQFTDSPGFDDYPTFSPDGHHIAFTTNRQGHFDIAIANVATGRIILQTDDDSIENFPSWTPDGRVSYISNRDGGFDLYVHDVLKLP
ncbi:MAG: hypothetical protein R3C02_23950 [Planctomycetaceae bacterium]